MKLAIHCTKSILCAIGISIVFSLTVAAQSSNIYDQKRELEKIKKEIENSKGNLDSLKSAEKKILKDISNYEQRASMNKTVLNRLNKQLSALRNDINDSKERLRNSEANLAASRQRFLGNLKYYYSGTRDRELSDGNQIIREKDAFRKIVYLKSLASYDKEKLTEASQYLKSAGKEYMGLVSEEKRVDKVRIRKKSEYTIATSQKEKREKELTKVRRKKESESDRLVTLSEAARQMEDLISRLEDARIKRESSKQPTRFDFKTRDFASYKGALAAPLKGTIISGYGWKTDKITKLKSFSPGIEIKGKPKSAVQAVASGVVAYVGNLRGYGNFIIIEHEDGFYSTYAGVDNPAVVQNQIMAKGSKLGVAPSGIIKFELRQGRESLDPVEWISLDSFK